MRKKLVFALFAALLSYPGYGQQLDPVTRWATNAYYEFRVSPNVVYQKANNVDVKLDVITIGPPSVARPTLIYFHGGGWLEGIKESTQLYALPYLARGMNTVNVEYRMAPESLAPAAVEDCRCALHWVYDHAKEYGFDTTKLVVAGHSAGGHLALMTGMLDPSAGFDNSCRRLSQDWRTGVIQDVKVAAIVDFFGPTYIPDSLEGPDTRNYAVRWFGNLPDRMELAKRLSPLTYVRKGLPSTIIVHGNIDPIVPYQQAVRLHEALDRAGVPNELATIQGGHGATTPFAWTSEQNLQAQEAVFEFLVKQGILSR